MAEKSLLTRLPAEIVDQILAGTQDLATLKNCAVAHRKLSAAAERILWHNVIVNIKNISSEGFRPPQGYTDPLLVLWKERLKPEETKRPPSYHRTSLVRHISLRAYFDISSEYPKHGIPEDTMLQIFHPSSAAFLNLKSVRIDGRVSQVVWDRLLELPALRELRLWPTCGQTDPPSDFQRLTKLEALEIGQLSFEGAFCLGVAVRQGKLKILHMNSTDKRRSVLASFLCGLTATSADLEERTGISEDIRRGFPPSLVELAIEDDCLEITCPLEEMLEVFSDCTHLTTLYLDLQDVDQFARLLRSLNLPVLARLHMPFVMDPSRQDSGDYKELMTEFLERHRETLVEFNLLNAAGDRARVQQFWPQVDTWLSLEEIRIDSYSTDDHDIPRLELEWTRITSYLGVNERDYWGHGLCRARLDRFDLYGVQEGLLLRYNWQKLKILILNPRLILHFGLLPEPNEHSSVRIRESEWKHTLGSIYPAPDEVCDEKTIAERIVGRMKSKSIRVISIEQVRFWIGQEPTPRRYRPIQKVWYLHDALKDKEQSRYITKYLDERDWKFLSEGSSNATGRQANTATFFKTPQLKDDLTTKNGGISEYECTEKLSSILHGISIAEFSKLPASQRQDTLNRLLVASKPIWIEGNGIPQNFYESTDGDATLLLQHSWAGDDGITREAQESYYGKNYFYLELHHLVEFLNAYEPSHARDFVKKLKIIILASLDEWENPVDLLELLECSQIQELILEIWGNLHEINSFVDSCCDIVEQLEAKIKSGFKIINVEC